MQSVENSHIDVGVLGKADSAVLNYAKRNEFGAVVTVTEKIRNFFIAGLLRNGKADLIKFVPQVGDQMIIPDRSFIRSTFDKQSAIDKTFDIFEGLMAAVIDGSISVEAAFDATGDTMANEIRKTITTNIPPANNPLTIAIKGEGRGTLRDTGRLSRAIEQVSSIA